MGEELATRDEFVFFHPLRVRWSELDPQGIVFNPNYFVYADIAMGEYLRAISFTYPEAFVRYGADTFAVRAEASFVGSAVYDDTLELAVRAEQLGRTSFRLLIGIFRGEALLTLLRMTYVYASSETKRPQPLSEELVAKIVSYERTPPARKT